MTKQLKYREKKTHKKTSRNFAHGIIIYGCELRWLVFPFLFHLLFDGATWKGSTVDEPTKAIIMIWGGQFNQVLLEMDDLI